MRQVYMLAMLLSLMLPARGQHTARLLSPDKQIVFDLRVADTAVLWSVSYKGRPLIAASPVSLSFKDMPDLRGQLRLAGPILREGEDDYTLLTGKTSHVQDRYRELTLPLDEKKAPFRKIRLVVRAFNDGLAFRYEFLRQAGWTSLQLTSEDTRFRLVGDPQVKALLLPGFTSSHEGEYTTTSWRLLKTDTLMDMPALFQFDGGIYMAITEAALLDYAGLYLEKQGGELKTRLSPLPDGAGVCVKASLPHHSPWRVLLISDRVGALIESNIITDLNEPCRVADTTWIRPGKTTFPWWNGNVTPDTLNAPGNNFVTAQYYIDFCAREGIQYHSVVEYGLHEWYVNDGAGFMPGPHADPTRAVPGLDMQEVCDYAHRKGVGIRVWVHWAALYPHLDSAFAQFERWGISGMMVDFMDRDDQEMVNIQTEILEKAALHHLHIQFHGAYKPTGLSRTYPNEFTREGTLNYEVNKWARRITPDHDLNMPFTRLLAGATDYHLGGFRAVPDSLFRVQYTRPLMMGTRCHMLAMYVVLETNLAMVCDYPAAYEGQAGFEFLQQVPVTWDETKVLSAEVDRYIVIARRKGKHWFIGGITNHERREVKVPMDFLDAGTYDLTVWKDGHDAAAQPNHLEKETRRINKAGDLVIKMAPGGGFAIHAAPVGSN
jgi:alpha-glucosidase